MKAFQAIREAAEDSGQSGNFFFVYWDAVENIIRQGGNVEILLAYLILASYTDGAATAAGQYTTAGASAIANQSGMKYSRVEEAMRWLQGDGEQGCSGPPFIEKSGTSVAPGRQGQQTRWHLTPVGDSRVYLPRRLLQGNAGSPSLARVLYSMTIGDYAVGIALAEARLDGLVMLLLSYRHLDLQDCGGAAPQHFPYREWLPLISDGWATRADKLFDLPGGCAVFRTEAQAEWVISGELDCVGDPDMVKPRIAAAIKTLMKLRLIHEVLIVSKYDEEGITPALYALKVFSTVITEQNPSLHRRLISSIRDNTVGPYPRSYAFKANEPPARLDGGCHPMGQVSYVAPDGERVRVIGVMRPALLVNDRDCINGRIEDRERLQSWAELLSTDADADDDETLDMCLVGYQSSANVRGRCSTGNGFQSVLGH
jgi:hypothetical protein